MAKYSHGLSSILLGLFLLSGVESSLIENDHLRQHLQDIYSNGRSHEQYDEKVRVRQETEAFFQNLQDGLPDDLRDTVEISTQNYTTVRPEYLDGLNIIFTIKGSRFGTKEDEVSVIGAHYDTQINTRGVNDNGSGMASLLEISRAIVDALAEQKCNFLNTIIAVAFDHEEMGLIGSGEYVPYLVSEVLAKYNVENFQGAYILETMLNFDNTPNSQIFPQELIVVFPEAYALLASNQFRGDSLITIVRQDDIELSDRLGRNWYDLVGGDYSTTEKYRQLNLVAPIQGNPLALPEEVRDALYDLFRSDHYRFWSHNSSYTEDGLKAVFITDTANFRGEMTTCYHNPCDDLEKVTDDRLTFLATASEALLRSMVSMSTGSDDLVCLYSSGANFVASFWLLLVTIIFILL